MSSIGKLSKISVVAPQDNCGFEWEVFVCVNEVGWHSTYDRWGGATGVAGQQVIIDLQGLGIPTDDGYDFFVYIRVVGGCDVMGMQRFNYDPNGGVAEYYISGSTLKPHLTGNYNDMNLTGSY